MKKLKIADCVIIAVLLIIIAAVTAVILNSGTKKDRNSSTASDIPTQALSQDGTAYIASAIPPAIQASVSQSPPNETAVRITSSKSVPSINAVIASGTVS